MPYNFQGFKNTGLKSLPARIGRLAALEKIHHTFSPLVSADIDAIAQKKTFQDLKSLKGLKTLVEGLAGAPDIARKLPVLTTDCKILLNAIKQRASGPKKHEMLQEIHAMEQMIGRILILNPIINLPDKMPPNYYKSTFIDWTYTKWVSPSRTPPAGSTEKLSFVGADGESSCVRMHLMEHDPFFVTKEGRQYALCHAEFDFVPIGNLAADHGTSSSYMVKQLQIMINAMNRDSAFCRTILNSPGNEPDITPEELRAFRGKKPKLDENIELLGKYFVQVDGVIYGNKRLYMEHENCVDDCWFLTTEVNTGGKGAMDFVRWLESEEAYGPDFFASELGPDNPLCLDYIMPADSRGVPLTRVAAEYSQRKYRDDITLNGYMSKHVHLPADRSVAPPLGNRGMPLTKGEAASIEGDIALARVVSESLHERMNPAVGGAPAPVDYVHSSEGESDDPDNIKPERIDARYDLMCRKGMKDTVKQLNAEAKALFKQEKRSQLGLKAPDSGDSVSGLSKNS